MILQPVTDIAEICHLHGLENAVLSPGSRCAPLTIAFANHPHFQVKTVSDERAAAFIGLGMAQVSGKASVLVCTSGTAAYNYAPAVAEAFYQQIPLLILTADRPAEWIDQLDGQTIRQTNIYGNHIKQSFTFPTDFSVPDAVWHAHRMVSEAINYAHSFPAGPVHINIPLREPFYPLPEEKFGYSEDLKIIRETASGFLLSEKQVSELTQELKQFNRILVVAGQQMPDVELQQAVEEFCQEKDAVLVADIISNFNSALAITFQDTFLAPRNLNKPVKLQGSEVEANKKEAGSIIEPINPGAGIEPAQANDSVVRRGIEPLSENLEYNDANFEIREGKLVKNIQESLKPDLVITFGKSIISKNLKLFLRKSENLQHWHIQPAGQVADTFQKLTQIIRAEPVSFFKSVSSKDSKTTTASDFQKNWNTQNRKAKTHLENFFQEKVFNEFTAYWLAMRALPDNCNLHVANSMAVRYANIIGLPAEKNITVFANRGTSGIDGSTSTAVGCALENKKLTVLFTGDLAFFYDRNGLWHNYLPENLRIVLFNNQGGGIFRLIDGPNQQPELDEYFETRQPLQAENTAKDFGLRYIFANSEEILNKVLIEFYSGAGAALLEIKTENLANAAVFKEFKSSFETN